MDKTELRTLLCTKRSTITCRETKNAEIKAAVTKLVAQKGAKRIFTYISMGTEVDTRAVIEGLLQQAIVYVPHTEIRKPFLQSVMRLTPLLSAEHLQVDKLGNLVKNDFDQVFYTGEIDLVLVPLLGFNNKLFRIGYGGGFYDRYLIDSCALKVGLAYDEQETLFLEEAHDVPLDAIITPTRLIVR